MILTTTNSIEDYKIVAYNGIVSGTAINMQKMGLTFSMQKYYDGISESITEVREKAFTNLKVNAEKMNANAVVGIQVDVELKSGEGLITVMITGTAVSVVKR